MRLPLLLLGARPVSFPKDAKARARAYGLGVDCARLGGSRESCPFGPASEGERTAWLAGFDGERRGKEQPSTAALEHLRRVTESRRLG